MCRDEGGVREGFEVKKRKELWIKVKTDLGERMKELQKKLEGKKENTKKSLTWKRGFFKKSSPRIHPQLHTSIAGPYLSSPRSNSGGRYHNVMTLLV